MASYPTNGIDFIVGKSTPDTINALAGDDIVFGEYSYTSNPNASKLDSDALRGGDGNDQVYGMGGNDFLYGDAGDDYLGAIAHWDDPGNDQMYGGTGNDTMYGGTGDDYLDGWEGNDVLYGGSYSNPSTGTGNDVLVAWSGNDVIYGGDGDDWLDGSYDNDVLYGGEGNDILGNSVVPEPGDDRMYGEGGNDRIYGGSGRDQLFAGTGNDTVYGGADNDLINGDLGNDLLYGEAGNDIIYGNKGNDLIDGGTGADTLLGSLSTAVREDTIFWVDNAADKIVDLSGTGIETVVSHISWDLRVSWNPNNFSQQNATSGLDHLNLTGSAVNGTGNQVDNTISGNNLNNTLNGLEGNDRLAGRGGDDTLVGGFGNDNLTGDDGVDYLNGYGMTVTSASQFDTLDGGAGIDYFILGGTWGMSYVEPGDGYAVITNWDSTNDWVDVRGSGTNSSQFRLDKFRSVVGGTGLDTEIYFNGERVGIVQDTTNVDIGRDFKFV